MWIADKLRYILFPLKKKEPAEAYDIWAAEYDNQPGNLMLEMDEEIFTKLSADIDITGKKVIDIGCGTGRHWKKILARFPHQLIGYDVSPGMLAKLIMKYANAKVLLLKNDLLPETADASCNIIISTLTVAHIQNIEEAFSEWNRVLHSRGDILITDYHPEAFQKGGNRTFKHQGKTIAVKNYIHFIEKIRAIAGQLDWTEVRFFEKVIDDSVKEYYEKQNALSLFESFFNTPIIYGIHFKKGK